MNQIARAAFFAKTCHEGQRRKYSNEHYIVHPFRVAGWTGALEPSNEDAICAAYLHDVIEDCDITELMLAQNFSPEIAGIVAELTNPSKGFPSLSRAERKAMDRNHLREVSSAAKLIKLIDRWDNLKDMPLSDPEARRFLKQTYLRESLHVCDILVQDELVARHVEVINLPQLIEDLADELGIRDKLLVESQGSDRGSRQGSR